MSQSFLQLSARVSLSVARRRPNRQTHQKTSCDSKFSNSISADPSECTRLRQALRVPNGLTSRAPSGSRIKMTWRGSAWTFKAGCLFIFRPKPVPVLLFVSLSGMHIYYPFLLSGKLLYAARLTLTVFFFFAGVWCSMKENTWR